MYNFSSLNNNVSIVLILALHMQSVCEVHVYAVHEVHSEHLTHKLSPA